MNYYERHLGDYAKDAGHLSMLEHGAYTLLLDRYYSDESPIPADKVYRIARARSADEQAAVDAVLGEFFTLTNDTWVHGRAEREIAKAQARIDAARENGRKGGRPKANPEETQQEPSGLPVGYPDQTQVEAHQAPDTRHQTPEIKLSSPAAAATEPPAVPHLEIIALYNQILGQHGLTLVKPDLWPGSAREQALRSRWREKPGRQSLEWWRGWFEYIATCPFLLGDNDRKWKADLEWLVTKKNFIKVCEGKYHG